MDNTTTPSSSGKPFAVLEVVDGDRGVRDIAMSLVTGSAEARVAESIARMPPEVRSLCVRLDGSFKCACCTVPLCDRQAPYRVSPSRGGWIFPICRTCLAKGRAAVPARRGATVFARG
jgi:hypothetical protein